MEVFETYRPLLFSIAYRMTGSASDAEDLVQDAYLRSHVAVPGEIRSYKSYLSTIIIRLCLDYLKSAHIQRERYMGVWLPEPVLTSDANLKPLETLEQRESIGLAFLVMLETLTPPERAVFLLHEVFDYPFAEIAQIIDKRPATCRQLFHRAKCHISERQSRFDSSPEAQQRLITRFLAACQSGDIGALTSLLAEDVTSWSDGGGKVSAALRPVVGRAAVARLCLGIARKMSGAASLTMGEVNGKPAVLVRSANLLSWVLAFEIAGESIQGLYTILNPDKLAYLRRQF